MGIGNKKSNQNQQKVLNDKGKERRNAVEICQPCGYVVLSHSWWLPINETMMGTHSIWKIPLIDTHGRTIVMLAYETYL